MAKTLIRKARVIAAPPTESAARQDILIEDDRILALGQDLDADGAEIVEAAGRVVIPGLVNAHLHAWQTALRGIAYDWHLMQYLMQVHGRAAPLFTPQDMYDGTLAGALNQISGGTTTIGDWCHNNMTPEHTDAAVAALQASGIRAVFLHGTPKPHGPHQSPEPQPRAEIERLLAGPFSARDGRLTLGLAIPGPFYSPMEVAEADLGLAKELGLVASMHHSGGPQLPIDPWPILEAKGLLGPHINIVHGNQLSDETLKRLVGAGVTITVTPEVEMGDGHGHPVTGRLRALGDAPSLGVDIETAIGGEMLTCARIALAHQRAMDHAAAMPGGAGAPSGGPPTAAEALAWATREGARAMGIADRTGTLVPGRQADLVMIDARAFNLWPSNNPVATALQAHGGNIEAVMVAGQWLKRDGQLTRSDVAGLKASLVATATRVAAALGLPPPDAAEA